MVLDSLIQPTTLSIPGGALNWLGWHAALGGVFRAAKNPSPSAASGDGRRLGTSVHDPSTRCPADAQRLDCVRLTALSRRSRAKADAFESKKAWLATFIHSDFPGVAAQCHRIFPANWK
jgi:hypothetical protein